MLINYLQIVRHSYRPVRGLKTCCWLQFLVPSGGNVGGCKGAIDGGVSGQMLGGQIGGKSKEDSHIGFISPFTHLHTQAASDLPNTKHKTNRKSSRFTFASQSFTQQLEYRLLNKLIG